MPWLGDGTWVQDANLARSIMQGKTNYRPWSHDLKTATSREMRLTSCCGAHSTYCEGHLCCKNCYEIVPIGEGDGNEFLNEEGE